MINMQSGRLRGSKRATNVPHGLRLSTAVAELVEKQKEWPTNVPQTR
jgi:hypothetical protein